MNYYIRFLIEFQLDERGHNAVISTYLPANEEGQLIKEFRYPMRCGGELLNFMWGASTEKGERLHVEVISRANWPDAKKAARKFMLDASKVLNLVMVDRNNTPSPIEKKVFIL